jgi:hypothetical protein
LANDNLKENFDKREKINHQLMLNKHKFSQIKAYGETVVGSENSNIVNGTLNSQFHNHVKLFNYISKLNGADVNVGGEIFYSKQTKSKYVKLMANYNF